MPAQRGPLVSPRGLAQTICGQSASCLVVQVLWAGEQPLEVPDIPPGPRGLGGFVASSIRDIWSSWCRMQGTPISIKTYAVGFHVPVTPARGQAR